MSSINVVVLGYSVVADTPGFVELAQSLEKSRYSIRKIGVGGVHLPGFKYLLKMIIDQNLCDLVIMEIGTPGWRWSGENQPSAYFKHLSEIVAFFKSRGQALAFWDLPNADFLDRPDVLYESHFDICVQEKLPYHRTQFKAGILRDNVHASIDGHEYYANELLQFLDRISSNNAIETQQQRFLGLAPICNYDSLAVSDLCPTSNLVLEKFSRSGLTFNLVTLEPNTEITLSIPDGWIISGLSYLIGPRSGTIKVLPQKESGHEFLLAYDKYAYYSRLGLKLFSKPCGSSVVFTQLEEMPVVELVKGTPDFGPRRGYLGHLLVSRKELQA